jgi:2-polyprenyl-3-methyl-5-hydroxy-6-metoxy-1,4-benzoquinol methylase
MSNQENLYSEKIDLYYQQARTDVLDAIGSGSYRRILEIGCGQGATGAIAKQKFKAEEVVGVELFESAAAVARTRLDKVICCDIGNMALDFPEEYFDCIICADVLEHTQNPWQVLEYLRSLLRPEGILVASLPNIQHLYSVLKILTDKFEYDPHGILDKTHLRFFTLHTIKKMFLDSGYQIVVVRENRSNTLKFKVINALSLGLFRKFTVFQYIVIVKKATATQGI